MKHRTLNIILWGCFMVSLLPFFYTIFYSMPSPDDFSMADINRDRNLFLESLRLTAEYWYGWVGMWFASFYETFFNPLNLFDDIRGRYGLTMCVVFALFLLSVYAMIKAFMSDVLGIKDRLYLGCVYILVAFTLINIDIYFEIFAWLAGSHYAVNMLMGFFLLALLMKHLKYGKGWASLAALSLLGCVTCSDYMTAVFVGVGYLFSVLYISKDGMIRKTDWIPLIFCIVGGLSAVAAPGNFRRNTDMSVSSLVYWKTGIQNTIIAYCDFSRQLIYNPLLFFSIILMVVLSYRLSRRYALQLKRNYIFMLICFAAVPPVTLLPVALGYDSHDFPNRIQFVFNTFGIIAAFMAAFILGVYIAGKYEIDGRMYAMIGLMTAIGIYVSMINEAYMADFPFVRMARDRVITRDFSRGWYDVLDEIKYSEEDDLTIEVDDSLLYLDLDPLIKSPGIGEYADHGPNKYVARYYGKSSVRVIPKK